MVETIKLYQVDNAVCAELGSITVYQKCVWDALNAIANEIQKKTLRDPDFEIELESHLCFHKDGV